MGNPWLIPNIKHFLKIGEQLPDVSLDERFRVLTRHAAYLKEFKGDHIAVLEMRAQASHYVKDLPHASTFRKALMPLKTMEKVMEHISLYHADLARRL
jgi:tRNA-dihydrouridine synthase B